MFVPKLPFEPPPDDMDKNCRGRWQQLLAAATTVAAHNPHLMPAVVRTDRYTRKITRDKLGWSPASAEQLMIYRRGLQAHLFRAGGPRFTVVVTAAALRDRISAIKGLMFEQLQRLLELEAAGHDIRVLPVPVGTDPEPATSFTILGFPDGSSQVLERNGDNSRLFDDEAAASFYASRFVPLLSRTDGPFGIASIGRRRSRRQLNWYLRRYDPSA